MGSQEGLPARTHTHTHVLSERGPLVGTSAVCIEPSSASDGPRESRARQRQPVDLNASVDLEELEGLLEWTKSAALVLCPSSRFLPCSELLRYRLLVRLEGRAQDASVPLTRRVSEFFPPSGRIFRRTSHSRNVVATGNCGRAASARRFWKAAASFHPDGRGGVSWSNRAQPAAVSETPECAGGILIVGDGDAAGRLRPRSPKPKPRLEPRLLAGLAQPATSRWHLPRPARARPLTGAAAHF